MENRQSNDVFTPYRTVVGCIWNSVPIDGTDILRSTVAISREFYFLIDINLSA